MSDDTPYPHTVPTKTFGQRIDRVFAGVQKDIAESDSRTLTRIIADNPGLVELTFLRLNVQRSFEDSWSFEVERFGAEPHEEELAGNFHMPTTHPRGGELIFEADMISWHTADGHRRLYELTEDVDFNTE